MGLLIFIMSEQLSLSLHTRRMDNVHTRRRSWTIHGRREPHFTTNLGLSLFDLELDVFDGFEVFDCFDMKLYLDATKARS